MVNIKLAFRTLSQSRVITGVAALSLALGIGANTAIFSLYDQLLLRRLSVSEPERLVNLAAPGPKPGMQMCGNAGGCDDVFSYPMFLDLQRLQTVFTGIAAHVAFETNLGVPGQIPVKGRALSVSGSYFNVLGLQPAVGRLLVPDDDRAPGASPVVVLSHEYWESTFGAQPSVVGSTIVVNGQSMTVVGVAPRGFRGTTVGTFPALFVPMTMWPALRHEPNALDRRDAYWAYLFARLKPGVSMEQARQQLELVYRPIITDVELPAQDRLSDKDREAFRRKPLLLTEGGAGQSQVRQFAGTPLLMLFGVAGIVLFIACANIANLLLSRSAGRSMEMAVRLALGASRKQLVMQLLTESCLLALLGGLMSVVLAKWTLSIVGSNVPQEATGMVSGLLNLKVLGFAMVLSIATGMLFGIVPAWQSVRPDLITAMRAHSGQPSGGRATRRVQSSLVVVQIALSTTLLIAAGLFVKSLMNVSRVELGLVVDHVVTFRISPGLNGNRGARTIALSDRIQQELAATPGVTAVAASLVPILAGSSWGTSVTVEGVSRADADKVETRFNEVSPGYLHALGMPLLSGREFTPADGPGAPKVAMVNETFARKFNLNGKSGRPAVGAFMGESGEAGTKLDIQIVGVVRDAKYNGVKDEVPALFFRPIQQDSTIDAVSFYARTTGDPAQLLRAVPPMIAKLDPTIPVEELKTLPTQVEENTRSDRMIGLFAVAFALLATLLAAVGLYGVLSYSVSQRTREIGLRMALGATSRRVRGMVLGQVARLTIIGGALGLAGALAAGRIARSLLYGLTGSDPVVVVLSIVALSLVALAAGYAPAWRASRAEPMEALRYE
ncbi:MAG: ABC transporter permease [Gemmatimonadaceae bacterium]